MKKIVGFLGVAILAITMFINTNNVNESGDITLDAVIGLSSANAECSGQYGFCDRMFPNTYWRFDNCMQMGGCG